MKTRNLAACAAACGMTFATAAVRAEDPAKDGAAHHALSVAGAITPAENDVKILQWLKIDCDALSECAEHCEKHATSEELKSFSRMVVQDHKAWCEACKAKLGDKVSAYVPGPKTATLIKDDGVSRDGRMAYAPTDFVAVKQKVCDHMKSVAMKAMKDLKGAELDKAYLSAAVMGHEAAIANIDAVSGNASAELAASLKEAKAGLQKHLDAAREMCKAHRTSGN